MPVREATIQTIWGGAPRAPYLTRVVLGRLRLHVFHRGDADPDFHDHPADFWTFPLVSYVEQYLDSEGVPQTREVRAFRLHRRRAEFAHRVVCPASTASGGQIATLVWWGRKRRDWGFHTSQGWVPWREYLGEPNAV